MTAEAERLLGSLPSPGERRVALRVTAEAERTLRFGHPWLYDQAIRRQSHEGRPGDLAVIFDRRGRFLAVGLYDPTSPIRVRVLQSRTPLAITPAWYRARLDAALALRAPLLRSRTTGYRLVHGENDGWPGLVADRYARTVVLKLYTAAWVPHLRALLDAFTAAVGPERIVLRLSRAVRAQRPHLHGLEDGLILTGRGLAAPLLFEEHGLRFEADPVHGQKTGFFLDQRENRAHVGRLSRGASVLDVFAYTGAFSLYAASGGARAVTSLDVRRPSLEVLQRHVALNRRHRGVAAARYQAVVGEAFELLPQMAKRRAGFDMVILDPPSFAKSRAEVPTAVSAYRRLTRLGLSVLKPGGTLVFSSCTAQVSAERFFGTVHRAAAEMKRPLRERARTGHPLDHPIRFPEGAYLKCLFAVAP